METETQSDAVVVEANHQLQSIIEEHKVPLVNGRVIMDAFIPFFGEARGLIQRTREIQVTDATQVTEIKASREARLKLREIRLRAEKARKALKEDSLRTGQAIDKCNGAVILLIEPEEQRLLAAEEFAERAETKRKAETRTAREALLKPYDVATEHMDLGSMTEPAFQKLLESSRLAHEARAAAAKKAAEDAAEAERKRQEEEAKVRAENERLRREAEERQREADRKAREHAEQVEADRQKAAAERLAIEEKARKEREAIQKKADEEKRVAEAKAAQERAGREKAEKELADRRAAEQREKALAAQREAKAARAPDKAKILTLAKALLDLPRPSMSTPDGERALTVANRAINAAAAAISEHAKTM